MSNTFDHFLDKTKMSDEGAEVKSNIAPQQSVFKDFVAGGAGGICLVITGQPLDTIKVSSFHTKVAYLSELTIS